MATPFATASVSPAGLWAGAVQTIEQGLALDVTDIRTLASNPVTIVAAPGANRLVVPVSALWLFKPGSPAVSFSGTVVATLKWGGTTLTATGLSFDGSVAIGQVVYGSLLSAIELDPSSAGDDLVDQPITIISGGDVTLGAGVLTVLLTYRLYDLTGLL